MTWPNFYFVEVCCHVKPWVSAFETDYIMEWLYEEYSYMSDVPSVPKENSPDRDMKYKIFPNRVVKPSPYYF